MNMLKLFNEKRFTDIELVLKDDNNNTVHMHVHKAVLACASEYFCAMFSFDFKKTYQEMIVPNALIMRDIIMRFYNVEPQSLEISKWLYILESLRCLNFLCIPLDVKVLYNIEVPAEGFDLFLEVMEYFDVLTDIDLIRTLRHNLPKDYDQSCFSTAMVQALSKKDICIVSGDNIGSIIIWDTHTKQIIQSLDTDQYTIYSIYTNNNYIIYGGNNKIGILDATTASPIHIFDYKAYHKNAVAFDNKTKIIAIISETNNHCIKVWDIVSGSLIHTIIDNDKINCLYFSQDGQYFISGHSNGCIKKWNATLFLLEQVLNDNNYASVSARVLAITNDNKIIVSGHYDNTIKIWNALTGELIKNIHAHQDIVRDIKFFGNDQFIVSASNDSTIRIWKLSTGEHLRTIYCNSGYVRCINVSDDEKYIISGDNNNYIKIWDISSGDLIGSIKNSAGIWSLTTIRILIQSSLIANNNN